MHLEKSFALDDCDVCDVKYTNFTYRKKVADCENWEKTA
jgi:hypothetical protein